MTSKMDASVDVALVRRAARGDERAFGVLVEKYKGMIYTTAVRLLNDRAQAEDAAQESFIKAYAALPGFRGDAKFSSWLYRICYNTCISMLRKRRPEVELKEEMSPSIGGPEADFRTRDLRAVLEQEVAALPDEYRAALTLYHFNGMSYDEIAAATRRPLGTIKAKIHRARALLRRRLLERVGWEELREVMWK